MRAYKDLREFLSVLEQQRQMLSIHDEVLPEPDMAAAACALTQIGEASPAIYFDKIAGFSSARVALNCTWIVVQPRSRAWHGKGRKHARSVF
jgi:UbiD family decarboxylase